MTDDIVLPPDSKAIPLTHGFSTIVDEADYEFATQWKWYRGGSKGYVYRSSYLGKIDGRYKSVAVYLHRALIGAESGLDIDHINGDPLDNRRCNLRICTRTQNNGNRGSVKGSTSKYKGVSWATRDNIWVARLATSNRKKRRCLHLGSFSNEADAARAYNAAALKYFGEFAKLNIIEENTP